MIPRLDWHPDEGMLQSYVDGVVGPVLATSVETHVLACASCRGVLVPAVEPIRLHRIRAAVEDRLDADARPWPERLLRRLGVAEVDARVLLAAPVLRRSWWLAVLLALGVAVLAAVQGAERGAVLLVLAPLLPVLTTAASYAPRLDPTLSLTAATPYPAMRLLLLRSGSVALAATVLAGAASLTLPGPAQETLGWLLPAVGLTAATLALSTWVDATTSAAACCAGWLIAVWVAAHPLRDPLAIYQLPGQLASAVLLVLAVAVLVQHRHRLDPGSQV